MGKSFVDSRKVTSSVNGKRELVPAEKRIPKPKKVSSILRAFFHLLPHPLFSCRGSDASPENHQQSNNCVIGKLSRPGVKPFLPELAVSHVEGFRSII